MSIQVIKGDLIKLTKEGKFDSVCHGCNCFHTMGAGIAPMMNRLSGGMLLEVDKQTPYGNINKLGTVSFADVLIDNKIVRLFNLYTQFNYGSSHNGEVYIHWDSLYNALHGACERTGGNNIIGLPLIGCGLAGGTKEEFLRIVEEVDNEWPGVTFIVVEFA